MPKAQYYKNQAGENSICSIFCPACGNEHTFDLSRWQFNGDLEKPTFSPSMNASCGWTPKRNPQFPILRTPSRSVNNLGRVREVPWEMILPHEGQAVRNHYGQSLEFIASRGGLSPREAVAVLKDIVVKDIVEEQAESELVTLVNAFYTAQPWNRCHSFVREGRIEFLGDCTHAMVGQTVDLPDIEHLGINT